MAKKKPVEAAAPVDYSQNSPEENIALLLEKDETISALQAEAVSLSKSVQNTISRVAPGKVILTFEGEQFELKPKKLTIPKIGRVKPETLNDGSEESTKIIKLLVEKYPNTLKKLGGDDAAGDKTE